MDGIYYIWEKYIMCIFPNNPTINDTAICGVFTFKYDGYGWVRLISGGNVGVGTTTPTYKLEVNGSFAA